MGDIAENKREIQNHSDNGRGDARERAGQILIAAQDFDVGRAKKNEEEAREESGVGWRQSAQDGSSREQSLKRRRTDGESGANRH